MPGRGRNMGDGWETKRNRNPDNKDWVIIKLGHPGKIKKVIVDTHHFKGNFPDRCSIDACLTELEYPDEKTQWAPLLPSLKLEAHHEHLFEKEIMSWDTFSHVRLNIFPDGGISRLRLLGWPTK